MHEKYVQFAARIRSHENDRAAAYDDVRTRRTHVHTPYIPLKTHAIEDF